MKWQIWTCSRVGRVQNKVHVDLSSSIPGDRVGHGILLFVLGAIPKFSRVWRSGRGSNNYLLKS